MSERARIRWCRRTLAAICLTLLPVTSPAAEPSNASGEPSTEEIEHCVSQHDSARQLRLNEQWFDARAAMIQCAAERCPLAIGADCRSWLDELNRALPTLLVFVARDRAAHPVRVELDGRAIDLPEPPVPIELAPGPHRLHVVFAERAPIDREFTLERGEKNHLERIEPPAPPQTSATVAVRIPPPRPSRPIRGSTYLLSAGALAAFTASTALLISALRERDEARITCAPTCPSGVRRRIETQLVFADVSAGVGVALGALAVYSFVRRPVVQAKVTGPSLIANQNGLKLTWQGEF